MQVNARFCSNGSSGAAEAAWEVLSCQERGMNSILCGTDGEKDAFAAPLPFSAASPDGAEKEIPLHSSVQPVAERKFSAAAASSSDVRDRVTE